GGGREGEVPRHTATNRTRRGGPCRGARRRAFRAGGGGARPRPPLSLVPRRRDGQSSPDATRFSTAPRCRRGGACPRPPYVLVAGLLVLGILLRGPSFAPETPPGEGGSFGQTVISVSYSSPP